MTKRGAIIQKRLKRFWPMCPSTTGTSETNFTLAFVNDTTNCHSSY